MANQHLSQSASQIAGELASAAFEDIPALIERYAEDPRAQVIKACERARRKYDKERAERDRVVSMYARMREVGGNGVIVGVDEVGRGSVAGPLMVAAVALPDEPIIWGINDSKKLSAARREVLAEKIAEHAVAIGFGQIPAADIDRMGMAAALREAVRSAVADTGITPDCVLTIACIAAASIVAKVTRDELMVELDAEYPGYHFADSKGYASSEHIAAIKAMGLSEVHRVSFCGNFLETESLF